MRPTRILCALLACAPLPVLAQSDAQLDRLEATTVVVAERMEAFMVARAPALAGLFPDPAFSPEVREAARCQLQRYADAGGDTMVEAYLEAVEAQAIVEIVSLASLVETAPEILMGEIAQEAMVGCGMLDLQQALAEDSGLAEAMRDPNILMQLLFDQP